MAGLLAFLFQMVRRAELALAALSKPASPSLDFEICRFRLTFTQPHRLYWIRSIQASLRSLGS
jgi:hypothetical protein